MMFSRRLMGLAELPLQGCRVHAKQDATARPRSAVLLCAPAEVQAPRAASHSLRAE
jgi:hypothetical protein